MPLIDIGVTYPRIPETLPQWDSKKNNTRKSNNHANLSGDKGGVRGHRYLLWCVGEQPAKGGVLLENPKHVLTTASKGIAQIKAYCTIAHHIRSSSENNFNPNKTISLTNIKNLHHLINKLNEMRSLNVMVCRSD